MLKADLHLHTNEDPKHPELTYNAKQLIDRAAELDYDVLALTYHNKMGEIHKLYDYAQKKGILLLSGVERNIERKHVLVYNLTEAESHAVNSFNDLAKLKLANKEVFVIAPHPFHFTSCCLGKKLEQYLSLVDAAEFSWYYTKLINPNRKLMHFISKHPLPIVGNSDLHRIEELGKTFSLIDAKKDKSSVFAAIKSGKVKIVSKPIPLCKFLSVALKIIFESFRNKLPINTWLPFKN